MKVSTDDSDGRRTCPASWGSGDAIRPELTCRDHPAVFMGEEAARVTGRNQWRAPKHVPMRTKMYSYICVMRHVIVCQQQPKREREREWRLALELASSTMVVFQQ